VWGGGGGAAGSLGAARAREPEVVHRAAHLVPSTAVPGQRLLALRLGPTGRLELVGPVEISRWRYKLGTVVLSGCSSASGPVLPAEGLMGMTRAWLAAGAQSVVASLWPVDDDSGEFFSAFYRHLAREPVQKQSGAAEALRRAQLEMIRSDTWRSRPEYWAAYLLAGKEGAE